MSDLSNTHKALGFIIIAIGIIALFAAIYASAPSGKTAPIKPAANTTTISAPATISNAGVGGCPMLFYTMTGSVTNSIGMKESRFAYDGSAMNDYMIEPGSSGVIDAKEYISDVLSEPSGSGLTNRAHYAVLQAFSGNSTTSGINLIIDPKNFTIRNNESLNVTVEVNTTPKATGTFILYIDGPCGGVTPVLLTVGDAPYNGSLPKTPYPIN
jgi:hypothetical protein